MGFTFWEAGSLLFANDILYMADTEFVLQSITQQTQDVE